MAESRRRTPKRGDLKKGRARTPKKADRATCQHPREARKFLGYGVMCTKCNQLI